MPAKILMPSMLFAGLANALDMREGALSSSPLANARFLEWSVMAMYL